VLPPANAVRVGVRAPGRQPENEDGMSASPATILYVDDDADNRRLFTWLLQEAGFDVQEAVTGGEALRRVAEKPDLVILDVRLPDINGFEVCRRIKADPATSDIPVLHLSGAFASSADKVYGLESGADGYLVKPVAPEEVLATVRALLRMQQAEKTAFEAISDGVCLLDQHGHVARCNRAMAALLERTEVEIIGRPYGELLANLFDRWGMAPPAPDGQVRGRETREVRLADRWFRVTVDPVLDDTGTVAGTVHIWADVSERRRAEEALRGRAHQQAAVAGLGLRALATTDPGALMHEVVARVAQTLEVEYCGVLELLPGDQALLLRAGVGWQEGCVGRAVVPFGDHSEADHGLLSGGPVVAEDLAAERYPGVPALLARHGVVSMLSVLIHGGNERRLGVLCAATAVRRTFSQDDVHFLQAVANLVAAAIERGRAEDALLATQMEFRLAWKIQQKLFPVAVPDVAGFEDGGAGRRFDIAGASYPAEATGGDYFDYIPLPDGSLAIAVGDVSGHGFSSALLMAETRAYLRALARTHADVSEILTLANQVLSEDIEDAFITLLLVRLDPCGRSFVYASAGHLTGYVLDASGAVKRTLASTGMPLGIDPGREFPSSGLVALEAGDLILLFTDGAVEARAPDDSEFGVQRVLDIVRVYRRDPARYILHNLYHAVRAFSQETPQRDDITAVVVKVLPAP